MFTIKSGGTDNEVSNSRKVVRVIGFSKFTLNCWSYWCFGFSRKNGVHTMIWLDLIIFILSFVPIHELGHYVAAKRNGWKNIRFTIHRWRNIPVSFAVVAEDTLKVDDLRDFKEAYFQLTRFSAMGSLFSMLSFVVFYYLGIISVTTALMLLMMMALYMMWELTSFPIYNTEEEKK